MCGEHGVGCRCGACAARWAIRFEAMQEFCRLAGLSFVSPFTAREMADLWRSGIREAFPDRVRQRLEALETLDPQILEEVLNLILD